MGRPVTRTEVANLAIDRLGGKSLGSIDPPTTQQEQFIDRWYEIQKEELLRKYAFNFAKKRITLTPSGTPLFEYAFEYTLPNDYIRLLYINNFNEEPGDQRYKLEGNKLLIKDTFVYSDSDQDGATNIEIVYIYNTNQVTLYDPLFINLLSLNLAIKVAYRYTADKDLIARLQNELGKEEAKAISITGQERPPKKRQVSRYLQARRRRRPWYTWN